MKIIHTLAELREELKAHRHPAVVPTMGNLHAGHIALVKAAKPLGDVTLATIFVNRLQFGPKEDFATYPRTLEADCKQLEAAGCDIVFAPAESEMYPAPQTFLIDPPAALTNILEGEFRPGFFTGVATVVMKLLSLTQARTAVFGKKDYQQLMVVRQMVQQFSMPVDIVGLDTLRAEDGLALSSRNGYLSAAERVEAVRLSQTLRGVAEAVRGGNTDYAGLQLQAMQGLSAAGWKPDYVEVRRRVDLQVPTGGEPLVVLAAAKLGTTRLIDNLEI